MSERVRLISSLARHHRALLRSAAHSSAFEVGQKLHATAITSGLLALSLPNAFLRNTIVHMYAACGDYRAARKLFDEISNLYKDTVDWTTLMNCYIRVGLSLEAIYLFLAMQKYGPPIDEITLVSFFSACSKSGNGMSGYQAITCLIKKGYLGSAKACNAAMDMFVKCGLINEARKVFDEMSERDIVSWTVLLEGVAKWEGLLRGKAIFHEMPEKNEVAWTIMIAAYINKGRADEAFSMLKEMVFDSGYKLNFVTLCSILSACTRSGDVATGRWVHAHTLKTLDSDEIDIMVGTSLIDMYAKCGRIDYACKVFQEITHRNLAMWNAILSGLAMHGKGTSVMEMLDEMVKEVKPDDVTLTSVLGACSHSGLVDEGRAIFSNLESKYGIKPSMEHYACVVDLLGRAGHLEEAEAIIMRMLNPPNEFVLGSLLASCHLHGKLDLGERVMQDLLHMYPENIEYHVLLSNMYRSMGKPDMADSLRKVLKFRGVKKVPGRSSVQFGDENQGLTLLTNL